MSAREPLSWRHADGFELPAIATRAQLADLPHLERLDWLQRAPGWASRAFVARADPADANAALHHALRRSADEVEVGFDALVRDALAPNREPEAHDGAEPLGGWPAPGEGGVAVHTEDDFRTLVRDLDLAQIYLALAGGESVLPLFGFWLRCAAERGVPRNRLRGALDVDPIARLLTRRMALRGEATFVAQRTAPAAVFDSAAAVVRFCAAECPGVRPLVVSGQEFHLAGAPPALELGATLAGALETATGLGERGIDFAAFTAAATVQLQVGHDLVREIAKLRALRLLWVRIGHAFGADGDALRPRVLAITSGRQRSDAFDQHTNLVRSTVALFAAVAGGADSVLVTTFDESTDPAAEELALDQHHLLREEGQLARTADPFAGSFAVESLTDALARRAFEHLVAIEQHGGLLAAAQSGFLLERITAAEQARETDFRTRRRILVGINRFADLEHGGPVTGGEDGEAEERGSQVATDRFERWLAGRDAGRAQRVVERLRAASAEDALRRLAEDPDMALASVAELATAQWPPPGTDFEHRLGLVAATDGHEFEDLRATALDAADEGVLPRALLLPLGDAKTARARAAFARDLLLVGGVPVDDPGVLASVEAAVAEVRERRPAVAVLCCADADQATFLPALRQALAGHTVQWIVAGRPAQEIARDADGSIHAGMDAVAWLRELQRVLGIASAGDGPRAPGSQA